MTEPILAKRTAERPVLAISQLTQQIKALLERQFRDLWIRGEISHLSNYSARWRGGMVQGASAPRVSSERTPGGGSGRWSPSYRTQPSE